MWKSLKKKLRNLREDIAWHWNDKVGTLYSWWDNLCRICDFIPVLWRDWDFDARPGLYRIMRKKLERLEPCLREGHLMNGERYARQVRVAMAVLDRIIADEYEEEEGRPVDEKWGKMRFEWKDAGNDAVQMLSHRDKADTPEKKQEANEEYVASLYRAEDRRERDIKWVFRFIARWHRHWWD